MLFAHNARLEIMELRQLRYLVEVVAAGSINRAAERLNITQSAVSRQIADLEEELGVSLLHRSRGGVSPTEQGKAFVASAGTILHDVAALKRSVSANDREPQQVRLGLPPTISPMFLDAIAHGLLAGPTPMRACVVEASSYWLQQRLYASDLDCAILTNPGSSRAFYTEPLWTEHMCIVGPAASPLSVFSTCTISDIAELPLIQTPMSDKSRQAIEAAFEAAGFTPNVRQEHEALHFVKEHIRKGGYSILPRTVSRLFSSQIDFTAIPSIDMEIHRAFCARRGAISPSALEQLTTTLKSQARENVAGDDWIRMD